MTSSAPASTPSLPRARRVLILEPSGNLWGSERVLLDFLGAVAPGSWQIGICCPPRTQILQPLSRLPVTVLPCFESNLHLQGRAHRLRATLKLWRAARRFGPGLIYVNQAGATRIALLVGRLLRVPVVTHVRLAEDAPYVLSLRAGRREMPKVVCISQYVRSLFAEGAAVTSEQLEVLYDPYATAHDWASETLEPLGAPRGEPLFGCVGRLARIKGQDVLLEAVASLKNLHHADLVVMPDRHRAEYVQKLAGLKTTPLVVMNCPRLLAELPDSRLIPLLRGKSIASTRIVHYQGAVGPHHHLEEIILSMRHWPLDAVFTIVGAVEPGYRQQLLDAAAQVGAQERLVFVGRVPYDQVFAYAVGASVGVSFLDGKYLQWRFSAGASNKRFEYAALGIPQVTNDLPGVRELFEQPGIAAIADADDVADIGAKIARYLEDQPLRAEAGARARRLHLEQYNYERQMEPLLKEIEHQLQRRR